MKNSGTQDRSLALKGVAWTLNTCGRTVVYSYDVAKKASGATKEFFGMQHWDENRPKETAQLLKKIKIGELRLKKLYRELGRKSVEETDPDNPLAPEEAQDLLTDIKEFKSKIDQLKERVVEIEAKRTADLLLKNELKSYAQRSSKAARKSRRDRPEIRKAVRQAIADALEHGDFSSGSDRVTFQTIASDLMDREMEIKILATAELGKMKCVEAVDVLKEALKFDDQRLTLEIMGSLATIGNHKALPVFFENLANSYHRIRTEALTGFYKWSEDKGEVVLSLLEALEDEHPEVRMTAVTLLNWEKELTTVPALVECLNDKDERVRKAAISALANIGDESALPALVDLLGCKSLEIRENALNAIKEISGEDIPFDFQVKGKELSKEIENVISRVKETRASDAPVEAVQKEEETKTEESSAKTEEVAAPERDLPGTSVKVEVLREEKMPEPVSDPVAEETAEEVKEIVKEDVSEELKVEPDVSEIEEPTAKTEESAALGKDLPETPVEPKDISEEETTEPEPLSTLVKTSETEIPPSKTKMMKLVRSSHPRKVAFSKKKLKKMVKPQLLSLCKDLNIECDYTETKARIIEKILEH